MDNQKCLFSLLIFINLSTLVFTNNYWCYDQNGNYTTNSTYYTNLKTLLSSLPSNTGDTGFYNASLGQNSDRVNAMAVCRTDLQLSTCRSCIQNASSDLVSNCPNRKHALVWADTCMVRYSNESFLGIANSGDTVMLWSMDTVASPDQFNDDLRMLIDDLGTQTASGGSQLKVAVGNRTSPNFRTIYSLLQCTPDISEQDCTDCLKACARSIPGYSNNAIGVRILKLSCNLRYEVSQFYNITRIEEVQQLLSVPAPASASMLEPSPRGNDDNNKTRTIVIVVVPILFSLALFACFGVWLRLRRKKESKETIASGENDITTEELMQYDFSKIRKATNDFSDANKLGSGGFGNVYKGKLENGKEIAVKRLVRGSIQGDSEFRNEVMLLAKLQHRNLVRLVGFALEGNERVLIYEFIQNGSLDRFIFDPTKSHSIDWNKRFKIISGIARGLLYLHEDSRLRVIHRDLKPSNILLDANMNPKIADFGIARLCEQDATEVSTSKIAGTRGYIAPEYIMRGQFSIKSDVFSFGMLVLEIISGKRNSNYFQSGDTDTVGECLQSFVWRNWHEGTITKVIDPTLQSTPGCFHDIARCVHVALLCIEENASKRPTMASVVLMLSSSTVTLPLPSNPPFSIAHNFGVNSSPANTMESGDIESFKLLDVQLAHLSALPNSDSLITELHPR